MKKYGLFEGAKLTPTQTYEGDEMKQEKEYVLIYRVEPVEGMHRIQVAAIRLAPGQSVKEI